MFFPKLEPYKDFHYMPISLLSVAAPLVRAGFECKIIDERIECDALDLLNKCLSTASCLLITAYTGYQVQRAYETAKYVRQNHPNIKIIWGGPHATHLSEQSIKSDVVDIVFCGYAESSIVDLITAINSDKDISGIYNIYYKDKTGKIYATPKTCSIDPKTFADMPYDLVDPLKYINPATKRFIYISTYGCPGICTFCSTKTRRPWMLIDIEKVKRDIKSLMSKYDYKECVFFDATLFTFKERALELSRMMKEYGVRWIADARAQEIYNIDEDMLGQLVENGLKQVTVGLETGSDHMVDIMRKGEKHLLRYKESAQKLSKFNIKLTSGVIFGCPGETIDDLKQTIAYVKGIKKINQNFFISSTFYKPLPDTVLFDVVRQKGYTVPDSLEGWASLGESSHYKYNEWMDNGPWMQEVDLKEYKEIYDEFIRENKELFV